MFYGFKKIGFVFILHFTIFHDATPVLSPQSPFYALLNSEKHCRLLFHVIAPFCFTFFLILLIMWSFYYRFYRFISWPLPFYSYSSLQCKSHSLRALVRRPTRRTEFSVPFRTAPCSSSPRTPYSGEFYARGLIYSRFVVALLFVQVGLQRMGYGEKIHNVEPDDGWVLRASKPCIPVLVSKKVRSKKGIRGNEIRYC